MADPEKNDKKKKVALLGFDREGRSSFNFIQGNPEFVGAEIWILDRKPDIEIPEGVEASHAKLGPDYLDALAEFGPGDVIIRTPGARFHGAELTRAHERGATVTSATKLFFDRCPCPVVGVTGTKGKGTTSSLIYEILKADRRSSRGGNAFIAGNIGTPALDILPLLDKHAIIVLELSSFQLIDLEKSPHVGVALMVTSEHLDWHKNAEEYAAAKSSIVRWQSRGDFAVLAEDYPHSKAYADITRGNVFMFSRRHPVAQGTWVEEGAFWFSAGAPGGMIGPKERVCATSELHIPGEHNWENACAAITAAKVLGVANDVIEGAIAGFRGLEHRLELVAETTGGVRWYNDSYSTTPDAAVVAIEAFGAPKVIILGGSPKGSDFTALGRAIDVSAKSIRAVIGIGAEWPRIKEHIHDPAIRFVEGCASMPDIVRTARGVAEPDDVVILSPACASFDMFKNYGDRGAQFKEEVLKLNGGSG